ncbi:MAG TPA: VCBS repeat-containing protein, partial [Catenuloplanes sp.]
MRHPLDRRWLAVATTLGLIGAGGVLAVGSPATAAAPGCAKLASDFNGDGYGDLAVGEPGTSDPGTENTAGAVRIAYGAAAGIGAGPIPEQTFRRGMPGMPPAGSVSWQLGNSLQAGYLNADCYADLAVSGVYTGEVIVLFGSATGLGTNGAQRIAAPTNVSGDDFGSSLAAGDFDGDGWDELAAGYSDANGVAIYRRAAGGLDTTASSWWSRGTPGVPENVHEFGGFGSQLAAGDFDADGRADLAVGVKRTTATVAQAGGVVVLRGSAAGLTGTGSQWFDQDSPDVPDTNEEGDLFGSSLAAGD